MFNSLLEHGDSETFFVVQFLVDWGWEDHQKTNNEKRAFATRDRLRRPDRQARVIRVDCNVVSKIGEVSE